MSDLQTGDTPEEWNLMLVAVSEAPLAPLLERLSHAIEACGGWALHHGAVSDRCADIDFEFPREQSMEIYCLLIATGIELGSEAHAQLASLCQCTRHLGGTGESLSARINLYVYARAEGEGFLHDGVGAVRSVA